MSLPRARHAMLLIQGEVDGILIPRKKLKFLRDLKAWLTPKLAEAVSDAANAPALTNISEIDSPTTKDADGNEYYVDVATGELTPL